MVARGVGRELAASVAAHRDILYRIQHPCGMIIPCFSPVVNTFFCGFGGSRNFRDIVTKTTGYSGVVWLKGRPRWHGGKGRTTRPAGACPAGCRLTLPPLSPAGGVPSLLPVYPAFSLLCCPHPPAPFPSGEGGDFLFSYARGFAPCIPGAEPGRHWFAPPLWKTQWGACPGVAGAAGVSSTRRGACLLCRLPALPLRCPRGGRARFVAC